MLTGNAPNIDADREASRAPCHTVLDMLRRAAQGSPKRGIYVIDPRGSQDFRTYPQLLESALRVGAGLQKRGLGANDRVLLVLPTSFEFFSAFFGALSIGAIPVPTAPPPRDRPSDASDRAEALLRMAERLQTPAALFETTEDEGERPPQLGELRHVLDVGSLLDGVRPGARPADVKVGEVAYLQPTSGATGRRRAVEVTHANVLSNAEGVGRKLHVGEGDIGSSWLPMHSSLGLVGVALVSMFWEIDVILTHPERFLKRPDEWLQCFGRHGATLGVAPNFGYDYCVRRCQESQLAGLDLSSWRVALCGGEPVDVDTTVAFRRRFGKFGFRDDAFTPVYGLTEATLAVAFRDVNKPLRVQTVSRVALEAEGRVEPMHDGSAGDVLRFASVGSPLPRVDVMVVDERGIEVPDQTMGEVAVRGPNVMSGYFDRPKTRSEGGTRLSGNWLMTGDLGYVDDGELFVVARRAATIENVDGGRLFCHLVESVAQSVDGVRAGNAAVFEAQHGGIVIAVEVQEGADEDEIVAMVRSQVMRWFRFEPAQVLCVSPHSLPRSTTGKLRRHIIAAFYEGGMLDRRARAPEFDGVRRFLQRSRHQALKLGQSMAAQVRGLFDKD